MQKSKNIKPIDKDGKRHGLWEYYLSNGKLWWKGTYHHGEPIGYWIWNNDTEYHAKM